MRRHVVSRGTWFLSHGDRWCIHVNRLFIKGVWLVPAQPFPIGQGATCPSVSCSSFTRWARLSGALGTVIGEHNNVLLLGTLTDEIVSFSLATTFELERHSSTMPWHAIPVYHDTENANHLMVCVGLTIRPSGGRNKFCYAFLNALGAGKQVSGLFFVSGMV